jgi:SAM-dependent methyltransferase
MDVIPPDWYKNWFGNEYLTVYAHRDEAEAEDLIKLIHLYTRLTPGARILDLCCGQGRHALRLAELGYNVIGLDLSRTLLQVAKFRRNPSQTANFVQADMRHLPAVQSFDLILNLFTSFGYFEEDQENQAVFDQFNLVLKPGGFFVFDYLNVDHVVSNLVPSHADQVGDYFIETERQINADIVQKKITIHKDGLKRIFYESVKMYDPQEIEMMLCRSGLEILHIFGDYKGNEFNPTMPRLLIIGQKKV